jgi:DeoR/GlpR family transcriptional regulator of sugar metabolism
MPPAYLFVYKHYNTQYENKQQYFFKKLLTNYQNMLFFNIGGICKMNIRQQELKNKIDTLGHIDIVTEAETFGVSEMTIRRDIAFLEKNGLAVQVKGGAIPKAKICESMIDSPAKNAIAAGMMEILEQMPEVKTLMLSTGGTTLAFARLLAQKNLPITVLTNSIPIASALFQTQTKVILTGGELRTTSMDLVGPAAEKYLSDYHVDLLLTGCDGADSQEGFYTSDLNLASYEKLSVKIADKTFILTESSKFERKALAKFAELNEIDSLITDNNLKAIDREILARREIKIITVRS